MSAMSGGRENFRELYLNKEKKKSQKPKAKQTTCEWQCWEDNKNAKKKNRKWVDKIEYKKRIQNMGCKKKKKKKSVTRNNSTKDQSTDPLFTFGFHQMWTLGYPSLVQLCFLTPYFPVHCCHWRRDRRRRWWWCSLEYDLSSLPSMTLARQWHCFCQR